MACRRCAGRALLLWGALALLVMAGYEGYARLDVLAWTVRGVYNLCLHEGVPFLRAWTYFEPGMFELLAHLAACAAVGLMGLLLRNRARAGYLLLAAICGLAAWGGARLGLYDGRAILRIDSARLVPMLAMALGAIVNLVQHRRAARRRPRAQAA